MADCNIIDDYIILYAPHYLLLYITTILGSSSGTGPADTVCWDTLYIPISVTVTFLLTLFVTAIITAVMTLLITKKCYCITPLQTATTPMVSCNNLNTEELCQSDRIYEDLAVTGFHMASNQAYGKARGAQ